MSCVRLSLTARTATGSQKLK